MDGTRPSNTEETGAARAAFEDFVRGHAATVLRFCLARCEDRHAGEDAAQEAMLRLQRQFLEGRIPAGTLSWALAVARRCCQEARRGDQRREALPLDESAVQAPAPYAPDPEVERQVETLSETERIFLYLKHTEGLRCREIARRQGQPLGTVTAALTRAYAKLRPRLQAEFGS